jgi:hypothetical protein
MPTPGTGPPPPAGRTRCERSTADPTRWIAVAIEMLAVAGAVVFAYLHTSG